MKYRSIRIKKDKIGRFCCGFMTVNGPSYEFNFSLVLLKENIDKKLSGTIAEQIYPKNS